MSLRRMVRLILSCVAVVAVAVSGATLPSGAQTTAENDCYIYAFGFLNPFLVAKLTIMGARVPRSKSASAPCCTASLTAGCSKTVLSRMPRARSSRPSQVW